MREAKRRGNPPAPWNQVTITTKNRGDSQDIENTLCAAAKKEVEAARKPGTSPTGPTVPRQSSIVNPERREGQACRDWQRAAMRSCGWWDTKKAARRTRSPREFTLSRMPPPLYQAILKLSTQKGNLSTPIGEQAPINTPEASSGTVSSDKRVTQKNDDVKRIAMPLFLFGVSAFLSHSTNWCLSNRLCRAGS